jgi:hypothetical protein
MEVYPEYSCPRWTQTDIFGKRLEPITPYSVPWPGSRCQERGTVVEDFVDNSQGQNERRAWP